MNRSDFLKQIALFSAGSALLPWLKQANPSAFTQLKPGFGIFSMQGGTIGWLVTEDAIVAVDSQFPDPASAFVEGILNYGEGPNRFLFNTHHHGDHTGGNRTLAEAGYRIIAHENVPQLQKAAATASGSEAAQAYAEETFETEYLLDLGSQRVRAAYYGAAHTKGDSVIWFPEMNAAHMGDLIFNRLYPFIDRNSGASIIGWIDLLETVYREADSQTLFIHGHANPQFGPTGTREDLMVLRDFLSHLLEYTRAEIAAGKSRDEITTRTEFEEFPDFLSPSNFLSLPRNLDVAWQELTEG